MKKETNPAYGMLSFHRVTGGDPNLFGSSVKHNQKIMLTLKEGNVSRDLSQDWYRGEKTLFKVEMSYTQFAELISAMNVGDGIPVTIRYTAEKGSIPGIETVNKRTQFLDEFQEKNSESADKVNELIGVLTEIFSEKRPIKAAEREKILSDLHKLSMAVNSHNDFMLKQYDESMEKVATEAKGEVEAFVQNKMNSLAITAMKEQGVFDISKDMPLVLPEENNETKGES